MNKAFYDICYEILSHYTAFSDVADTFKSINDGLTYQANFPWDAIRFVKERAEIISYIQKVRVNNVVDAYQTKENSLLLIPVPSGKLLSQSTPEELYNNLNAEIPRLVIKGVHQLIKHLNENVGDNELTAELLQQDPAVLKKYGVLVGVDSEWLNM